MISPLSTGLTGTIFSSTLGKNTKKISFIKRPGRNWKKKNKRRKRSDESLSKENPARAEGDRDIILPGEPAGKRSVGNLLVFEPLGVSENFEVLQFNRADPFDPARPRGFRLTINKPGPRIFSRIERKTKGGSEMKSDKGLIVIYYLLLAALFTISVLIVLSE
jgi:hypothetical protein